MVKVTLDKLYQELSDFKETTNKLLGSIETQTLKTNGRVNAHDTKLAVLTERYDTCPARELTFTPNKMSKAANTISFVALSFVLVDVILRLFNVF